MRRTVWLQRRLGWPLCVAVSLAGGALNAPHAVGDDALIEVVEPQPFNDTGSDQPIDAPSSNAAPAPMALPAPPAAPSAPATTPSRPTTPPKPAVDLEPAARGASSRQSPPKTAVGEPAARTAASPSPLAPIGPLEPAALPTVEVLPKPSGARQPDVLIEHQPERLPEDVAAGVDVVRERYPDGKPKIAYEVARNLDDNYVKHGVWRMWNPQGELVAEGHFRENQRHGAWGRWHGRSDSPLFQQPPYTQFDAPFYSEVEFAHGQMHGVWTIFDAHRNKISEIEFVDGQRHGKATWWYRSGKMMQEINFRDGQVHGELLVWTADGKLQVSDRYEEGRRLGPRVTKYPDGSKQLEAMYREAALMVVEPDDWWTARTAKFARHGSEELHGAWVMYHPNGQIHVQGEYRHGAEHGDYTWWYSNGQKALEGRFADGKRDGRWIWWHPNGHKATEGQYSDSQPVAQWLWWGSDGEVARRTDYNEQPAEQHSPQLQASPQPPAPASQRRAAAQPIPPQPRR